MLLPSHSSSSSSFFERVLEDVPAVNRARDRAAQWLVSRRQSNWGWDSDTARVLITLQLANISWLNPQNLSSQLSIKQLEIDVLLGLWSRKHENPLRAGRLAQYVYALQAVCKNPRDFHGHDLVAVLEHMETYRPFELGYVILAQCNTGAHIRKKHLRLLLDAFDNLTDTWQTADTVSMLVQALTCVLKQKRNRSLVSALHRPVKSLKKVQKEDGSFGNVHTSAMATQALLSMPDDDGSWNATAALLFLLSQQQEDGSFGNIWATSTILPILSGNSYVDIPNAVRSQCPENEVMVESSTSKRPNSKFSSSITYSLWIGNNITTNHTIGINLAYNASFFEIMRHAAELNSDFDFNVATSPNGHYIKSLSGLAENTTSSQYWLLGVKKEAESNSLQYVDVGIDSFYPRDGQHVVFWYKQI